MATFDVQRFVDEHRITPLQIGILGVCLLLLLADGFDIFMFGKVAPAIAKEFGTTPAGLTSVVAAQQIGLATGAFLISPFADRFGRKRLLELCALGFGLATIASVYATSIVMLTATRAVAGIFLAPVVPITLALLAEFTPQARRTTIMAVGLVGYGLGNAGSAFFTARLLPTYGWESLFWLCGGVGLACAALLQLIPESLHFRVARNPADPQIATTLRRLDRDVPLSGDETFCLTSAADRRLVPISALWQGRRNATLVFWAASFASMGMIALCASWMPSFFNQMSGVPVERFAGVASFGLLGGSVGTLAAGWLIDRLPATGVIIGFYTIQGLALASLGFVSFASTGFPFALFAWSMAQGGGQAALNLTITRAYPVGLRSSGLGWAGGAGRVGGILIPLLGGALLAGHYSLQTTTSLLAVGPLMIVGMIVVARASLAVEERATA